MSVETTRLNRVLAQVERIGNALPAPALLFLLLSALVVALSAIITGLGIEAVHPVKKEAVQAVNLLSVSGLHLILMDLVKNFTGFTPLGTVLVTMLGFSLAEKSGLLGALLRLMVMKSPRALLIPAVLVAGVISHTAGDIGYVLLIPLAAMAFHSVGMHPLAGLAICFAGVSGGYSANFLISSLDPLLAGLTQEASRILDPNYTVTPVVNWYFMSVSSILIVGVGTLIAKKITIPFLGDYNGEVPSVAPEKLSPLEKKALLASAATGFIFVLFILAGLLPENGYLRNPENGSVLDSPAMKGLIALIFLGGASTGLVYGWVSKRFQTQGDIIEAMQSVMSTMAPYLVMVFFASQFIALFNASNVGLILAIHGSDYFKDIGLSSGPLLIAFILLTCILDIFIGSASAKWALMAPVFVPMFMLLGISPELSQASYRIADSVINIVSPLMPYFPLILAFANRYDKKARVGTLIALMLPYSIGFLISWSILLFIWMTLNLPLGPGAKLSVPIGQ